MPNHLINENSPYLLQHADNPVDWYPWCAESLERANSEDKPIFLSIGYAACHWCHVMAHESFEDDAIAAILNEFFINIKVDREERPDLDSIYMQAVVAMTGHGGWPMSVFLTPDGKPFYGGTYFPPVRRYNMPSFRELLLTIANLWREDRKRLLESSQQLINHLQHSPGFVSSDVPLTKAIITQAATNLAEAYDWDNGGWGKAPKFPQPMSIDFLLSMATRGDIVARDIAAHALRSMAKGGMYDVIGGGFARYSTDDRWSTPHFEKMLYDNAQLASTYLHGWLVINDEQFRVVCEETLDFVIREMVHPEGGFYSSIDADSEGEEGKFYVWTPEEIGVVLHDPQDVELITAAYNITKIGNFEGKNILQRALGDEQLASMFSLPVETLPARLHELRERLLVARSSRVRPNTDDKILVTWNALMLIAFAEAGYHLSRPDYLDVAQRNAHFLLEKLLQNDRLSRSWRCGKANHHAYLEDYSALILGLLSLYQSDSNPEWYLAAIKLLDNIFAHFVDRKGGFFDTSDDHETLLIRPKDIQDNATPSGNALAALALLKLSVFEGRTDWRMWAEDMLSGIQDTMVRYPGAFSQWLKAADFAIGPHNEVVIIGDPNHPNTIAMLDLLGKSYHPRVVLACSSYPPIRGTPGLSLSKPEINDLPTAYVCQDFVCLQPTNSPELMVRLLSEVLMV